MIRIEKNEDCCGCNGCVQICPRRSIEMKEDKEGFLYPDIDLESCIDCGICEKICPVINPGALREPLKVYGAKNKNEGIRIQSSSGGVFSLLAESVITKSGVVFGARFNDQWEVVHSYTENREGIAFFRGSKYVQSRIGQSYKDAERFLKDGRLVLFSGTPCQIAGLKLYLRKAYTNLLTVDFVCHGVPSPKVWRMYLSDLFDAGKEKTEERRPDKEISQIDFRNKIQGWRKYSFVITRIDSEKNKILYSQTLSKNIYLRGFLNNLYLRPSCHRCPSRTFKSGSDITIADFWAVGRYHPEIKNDDKGLSLILIMSSRGEQLFSQLQDQLDCWPSTLEIARKVNPSIFKDASVHKNRNLFFSEIPKSQSIQSSIHKNIKKPIYKRLIILCNRITNKLIFLINRS